MTMTELSGQLTQQPVDWQGVHHLALITNDMDATVRFWHGVLGADLVATIGNEMFRHYFFNLGPSCSVAFFEYRGDTVPELVKPAGVFDKRACQFDHVAMHVQTVDELDELRARLTKAECEVTDVVDHKIMKSIYFNDPNGIALEASCWIHNPTSGRPDFSDPVFFADSDPVSAVDELIAGGLVAVPATKLA